MNRLVLTLLALLGLRAPSWDAPIFWGPGWEEPTPPPESTPLPEPPTPEPAPIATPKPPCVVVCPPGWGACHHECGDGDG